MKKDTIKTDVIFRVDQSKGFKGTVFALFPHECADFSGNVTSYRHVGQHSGADYKYCLQTSKLANKNEFSDLKNELEGLGYNLNIVKRQNNTKYLKSYKSVRNW